MVFNAIFNTILVISWRSVLLVEEYPEKTTDCRKCNCFHIFSTLYTLITTIYIILRLP